MTDTHRISNSKGVGKYVKIMKERKKIFRGICSWQKISTYLHCVVV